MKKLVLISLFAIAAIGGVALAGCWTSATDCGTIVGVDMPEGGTCQTTSHDKAAVATSYDANGDFFDTDGHVCHIGPC